MSTISTAPKTVPGFEDSQEPAGMLAWTAEDRDVLLRFALHRLGDRHVAEDVVQDALLAAFECRRRFAGQSDRRTWLVGILKHKIADHYRHMHRARALFTREGDGQYAMNSACDAHADYEALCPSYDSPDRQCERTELWSALHEALALLPARTAEAFRRGILENGNSCRVCEDLGISATNYWVMMHRARKHLRDFLSTQGFYEPACG